MINLIPQLPQLNPGFPSGVAHGAPIMNMQQQAAAVAGGSMAMLNGPQIADIAPPGWWTGVPVWAKVVGGLTILSGISYVIWRLVR